jgi:hypothetical protein
MRAEVTFGGSVRVWIDVQGVIRTSLHAAFASDAAIAIEIDNSVGTAIQRSRWTDLSAWSSVTMVAAHDAEVPTGVRELAFLDVLYPGTKDADGHVVFFFTCHRAGMTSDASILIEYESIAHEELGSLFGAVGPQLVSEAGNSDIPFRWLDLWT